MSLPPVGPVVVAVEHAIERPRVEVGQYGICGDRRDLVPEVRRRPRLDRLNLFVTGTSVRNRLTKNPKRIFYRIEIGFEGDDRRDGLASGVFHTPKERPSSAVPAHTNTRVVGR